MSIHIRNNLLIHHTIINKSREIYFTGYSDGKNPFCFTKNKITRSYIKPASQANDAMLINRVSVINTFFFFLSSSSSLFQRFILKKILFP